MAESAERRAAPVRPLPKGLSGDPPPKRGGFGWYVVLTAGMVAAAVGAGLLLRNHLVQGSLPWQAPPAMSPVGETHLLQVLRTMPPRSAVALILQMPEDTAAALLGRLPPPVAGAYLSAMPPTVASRLALLMAAKGGSAG